MRHNAPENDGSPEQLDAVTLGRFLAALPAGVTVVHHAGNGAAPLRWVEPSELGDPTPYLLDGEFVLTAGLPFLAGATPAITPVPAAAVAAAGCGAGRQQARTTAARTAAAPRPGCRCGRRGGGRRHGGAGGRVRPAPGGSRGRCPGIRPAALLRRGSRRLGGSLPASRPDAGGSSGQHPVRRAGPGILQAPGIRKRPGVPAPGGDQQAPDAGRPVRPAGTRAAGGAHRTRARVGCPGGGGRQGAGPGCRPGGPRHQPQGRRRAFPPPAAGGQAPGRQRAPHRNRLRGHRRIRPCCLGIRCAAPGTRRWAPWCWGPANP